MIRLVVVVEALVVSLSLVPGRNYPKTRGAKYNLYDGGSDMRRFLFYFYHTLECSIPLVPVFFWALMAWEKCDLTYTCRENPHLRLSHLNHSQSRNPGN